MLITAREPLTCGGDVDGGAPRKVHRAPEPIFVPELAILTGQLLDAAQQAEKVL